MPNLRVMDLLLTTEFALDGFVTDLRKHGQELVNLSVMFGVMFENIDLTEIFLKPQLQLNAPTIHLPKLKRLSLHFLELYGMYQHLAKLVPFEALLGLSLYDCTETDKVVTALG